MSINTLYTSIIAQNTSINARYTSITAYYIKHARKNSPHAIYNMTPLFNYRSTKSWGIAIIGKNIGSVKLTL